MKAFLIIYHFADPTQKLTAFIGKIQSYEPHIKLTELSYVIKTDESPQTILDEFRHSIGERDNVYIVPLTESPIGLGKNMNRNEKWLQDNL